MDSDKAYITLRILSDVRNSAAPVLTPGTALRLELSPESRGAVTMGANFAGFAEGGSSDTWLLGINKPDDAARRLLQTLEERPVTTNLRVAFRNRSLLTAALERAPPFLR